MSLVKKLLADSRMHNWHQWLTSHGGTPAHLLWVAACEEGKGDLLALLGDSRISDSYTIALNLTSIIRGKATLYKRENDWYSKTDKDPYIEGLEQERLALWAAFDQLVEAVLAEWPWERVQAALEAL